MTSSNLTYENCGQFAPNFDTAYKTIQRVSVLNLKLFGPMKTELWAEEVRHFFIMLENWLVAILLPTMAAAI